ncbi:methyltransferase domain-containing protein [Candidatus Thorarchaeota archaeon]|nr:MAG: methyltransferase domain-containing protein [Candidatus Thorarchaeota archaeon]
MPRFDVWLVETGRFSSRQMAKRAIKQGLVTVNGEKVKPSKRVTGKENVVVSPEAKDYPEGYFKLKKLDELFPQVQFNRDTNAIDIGSSAGGFLHYLKDRGLRVTAIEISEQFVEMLIPIIQKNETLSLIVGNAFELEPKRIFEEEQFDVLLIDVTTDVQGTLELIASYRSVLKSGGILIAAFKFQTTSDNQKQLVKQVQSMGFHSLKAAVLDESTQEIHLVGNRQ